MIFCQGSLEAIDRVMFRKREAGREVRMCLCAQEYSKLGSWFVLSFSYNGSQNSPYICNFPGIFRTSAVSNNFGQFSFPLRVFEIIKILS